MTLIETRVSKLETEVRRWRTLAKLAAIGAAAWLTIGAQLVRKEDDVIRAKRVEAEHFSLLVDGKERAALGVDDQGADNRIVGLFLWRAMDTSNDDCARLVVFGQDDEPELVFKNRDHKFQAWLRTVREGGARLSLHDASGAGVERLSSERKD